MQSDFSLYFDPYLLAIFLPVYSVNGVIDDADKPDILSNVHVYLWFKFYYKPRGKFPRKMWMKMLITVSLHFATKDVIYNIIYWITSQKKFIFKIF